MVDYVRAIKRPFTNMKRLALGILLNLPIPLVEMATNTMALGYAFNCGKTASESKYEMPVWKGFGRLWFNAFVAGIIAIIYLTPAIILVFAFAKTMIMDYLKNRNSLMLSFLLDPIGFITSYGIGMILAWVFTFIIGYIIPIAMLNWIITGKFGSAFNVKDIFAKAFTNKYLVAWLILTIASMALGFITWQLMPLGALLNLSSLLNAASLAKMLLYLIAVSIIEFIKNVIIYTVYGNVLEELKPTGQMAAAL